METTGARWPRFLFVLALSVRVRASAVVPRVGGIVVIDDAGRSGWPRVADVRRWQRPGQEPVGRGHTVRGIRGLLHAVGHGEGALGQFLLGVEQAAIPG